MSDLISRQAAIDALKEHRALYCDNTPETFSKLPYSLKNRVDELDAAIATIVNLPSAEPKTGKWLEKDIFLVSGFIDEVQSAMCSECGVYHTTPFMSYFDEYKFCPNCGARMKGGDE